MTLAEKVYRRLKADLKAKGAVGRVQFCMSGCNAVVAHNGVVGTILEEWLDQWMTSIGIRHLHNDHPCSPDFWLNPRDRQGDWLELKVFNKSPRFDVATFHDFVRQIASQPWKLHSQHLILRYESSGGAITIEGCWLKNLWEICSPSHRWPLKVQTDKGHIESIRPSVWYSPDTHFPSFRCLEHFLSALEETMRRNIDTRSLLIAGWSERLCRNYEAHYGRALQIPQWREVCGQYIKTRKRKLRN